MPQQQYFKHSQQYTVASYQLKLRIQTLNSLLETRNGSISLWELKKANDEIKDLKSFLKRNYGYKGDWYQVLEKNDNNSTIVQL
jgi:hypothetical protein